jgi:thiol-disulfide isomerase/thioredoxin
MLLVLACASSSAVPVPDQASDQASEPVGGAAGGAAEGAPANDDLQGRAPTSMASSPPQAQRDISDRKVGGSVGDLAPDFVGISNWINSAPLSITDLRGKVVLVDVWTYTCINCIRTFPFLRDWHARYADDGLVIVGLHAPEFEFEKNTGNVAQASADHGIVWPVAQDNDMLTWSAYENRYWPAKYLVDRDGLVRYTHFGEGSYGETEVFIRKLLTEAGADLSDDNFDLPEDPAQDSTFSNLLVSDPRSVEVTPELYAGYMRNFSAVQFGSEPYVVQTEYYKNRDTVASFIAPKDLVPHKVYFQGDWLAESERARHGRVTQQYEDYIAVKYSAKSVNAVFTSDSGEPYRVRITMDGEYLTAENRGADVMIAGDGESYIPVDEPRLYAIVDNPGYVGGKELRISSNSADFGLFAFTFGINQEGP